MAAAPGPDPDKEIAWIVPSDGNAMELVAERKVDAFLGLPPELEELRARNVGRVIVSTVIDRPWSQHRCCTAFSGRDFARSHPIAAKRALRAIRKASGLSAAEPDRAARRRVDGASRSGAATPCRR